MGLLGSLKKDTSAHMTTTAGRGGSSSNPNNLCLAAFNNDHKTALELLKKSSSAYQLVNSLVHWVSSSSVSQSNEEGQEGDVESPTYEALPLCVASIWGHVDMVQLLLEAGAKPFLKDSRGRFVYISTPIHN
jgi:ankyrin repeat protein